MRRGISYIRFSSERQLKGDSVRRQSKLVTDWLDKNPEFYLDSSLSFKDLGKSAFSGKHLKGGLGDTSTSFINHPSHFSGYFRENIFRKNLPVLHGFV